MGEARHAANDNILAGMRFGLLTVEAEAEPYMWRGRITHRRWECRCDCGTDVTVRQDALTTGHTRSCGCEKVRVAAESHTRHGGRAGNRRSYEYDVWQRLSGAARRGLPAPRTWQSPDGFVAFINTVGPRPGDAHQLRCESGRSAQRPANWRWVEGAPRQGRPRWQVIFRGRPMSLRELAEATGTRYATLLKRLERGQPLLPDRRGALRGPFAVG
jgi:hypothetical protein